MLDLSMTTAAMVDERGWGGERRGGGVIEAVSGLGYGVRGVGGGGEELLG